MPRETKSPLFSARHYRAIAAVLANAVRHNGPHTQSGRDRAKCDGDICGNSLAADIVNMLAADNPHFKRPLFNKAAGLDPNNKAI